MAVQKWLELALSICGKHPILGTRLCTDETGVFTAVMLVNTLVVLIAVVNRYSGSAGPQSS